MIDFVSKWKLPVAGNLGDGLIGRPRKKAD